MKAEHSYNNMKTAKDTEHVSRQYDIPEQIPTNEKKTEDRKFRIEQLSGRKTEKWTWKTHSHTHTSLIWTALTTHSNLNTQQICILYDNSSAKSYPSIWLCPFFVKSIISLHFHFLFAANLNCAYNINRNQLSLSHTHFFDYFVI